MYHYGVTHLVVTTIVKAFIYGIVFKLVRQLSLPECILLGVVVISLVVLGSVNRRRRRY